MEGKDGAGCNTECMAAILAAPLLAGALEVVLADHKSGKPPHRQRPGALP